MWRGTWPQPLEGSNIAHRRQTGREGGAQQVALQRQRHRLGRRVHRQDARPQALPHLEGGQVLRRCAQSFAGSIGKERAS